MDLKLILLVSLLFVSAFSDEGENKPEEQEEVFSVILTDDNFEETIKTNNFFVMFYAPWCGHCKRMKPTWNELAELVNTQDESRVKIAMVDCTKNEQTCNSNEVSGYPTLRFFKLGATEPVKYRSSRDLPSFTQFINDQLGLSTPEEEGGEEEKPAVPSPPQKGAPVELDEDSYDVAIEHGYWFIKFYAPWCGHCQRLAPTWTDLAKTLEFDETIKIGKVDCTVSRPLCTENGVKGYPTLLFFNDGKMVDKYSGPRSVEALKEYVEKKIREDDRSSFGVDSSSEEDDDEDDKPQIVEEGEGGAVVQLSSENFDQVIGKDVTFVALTASWCGHCKRLAPTWQQLAEKYVGDEKIKIAKIDCSVDENRKVCTQQNVDGYPTIYLYKDGKKISEYNGNRSLESMFDFVKSHSEKKTHDEF